MSRRQQAQATFRRVRFGLRVDCPEWVLRHVEASADGAPSAVQAFIYPGADGRGKAVLIAAPRPAGPARHSPEGGAA